MQETVALLQLWVWPVLILAGAVLLAFVAHYLIFVPVLSRIRVSNRTVDLLAKHAQRPVQVLFPLLVALLLLPTLDVTPEALAILQHVIHLGLIGSAGWLLVQLSTVAANLAVTRHLDVGPDDLDARIFRTRVQVLRRVSTAVLVVLTAAMMLMTFPGVRHLGISLLASAGFAGLAIGMAARPALANLIAGLQIALTQPIRVNDVVIVEGEWGWIEEISSTYVVVRVWDLRRLVVPLAAFIEHPFQNWTRTSADILGTVFVYADYTIPVDEVRQQLHRILEASPLWDRKVWGLQVTNATENVVELRALMSAPDSGTAWDLRCYVREQLIAFLRDRYPQCLPRVRAELRNGPSLSAASQTEEIEQYRKVTTAPPNA